MTAARWQPANETEAALARAMIGDDRKEFFRVLANADLYLPQVEGDDDETQTFITADFVGQTVLPVFTSVAGLSAFAGAYTVTSYAELREKWPRPQWWLAVNPGSPIDAYLPIESVEAAARGEIGVQTAGESIVDAMRADPRALPALLDTDEALRAAAERGDGSAYLEALLDAMVVVPTTHPLADPEEVLAGEPPWLVADAAGAPVIEVFTSAETFEAAFEEPGPSVVMPFALLLTVWPEGHGLSVNPRTPLAVGLPGEEVEALLWCTLGKDAGEGPGP